MEDNYNELNKNWRSLEESWNRVDESKSKKGLSKNDPHSATHGRATKVHTPKKGKGSYKKWKWKDGKRVEEAACGGMTAAGAGNIAGVAVDPTSQGDVRQAGYAERLGKKKPNMRENFDLNSLGKPPAPMGAKPPLGPGLGKPPMPVAEEPAMGAMEDDGLEGGVGDVIAAIQARYPGAVIEITVCAPENHRFSDADLSHATEVANSSEAPEELGGAWEKAGGDEEGMEDDEEGTKPFREEFSPYGSSKSKDSDAGDEPEEKEEPADDAGEDKPEKKEKKDKKPSFGGESEGGEGEDVDCHAGITEDSISLSPEAWSEFLSSVDMAGGEEGMEGDMDEGERSMSPEEQNDMHHGKGAKPPRKPIPHDPTETEGGNEDDEPDMVDPRA